MFMKAMLNEQIVITARSSEKCCAATGRNPKRLAIILTQKIYHLDRNPTSSGLLVSTKAVSLERSTLNQGNPVFFLQLSIPAMLYGMETQSVAFFRINDESYFKDKYEVDEVHFQSKNVISDYIRGLGAKKVLLLRAENSDSGNVLEPPTFDGKESYVFNYLLFFFNAESLIEFDSNEKLYPIMAELRVYKTDSELEVSLSKGSFIFKSTLC
ncbi:hypothetical protein COOONC_10256 [Cooperia oncophora]